MTTITTAARTATTAAMLAAIMLAAPAIAVASPNSTTPAPSPGTHVSGGFAGPDTNSGPANTAPPCPTPSLCQTTRPVERHVFTVLTDSNSGANDQSSVATAGLGGLSAPGSAPFTTPVPAHLWVHGEGFTPNQHVHVDILSQAGGPTPWHGDATAYSDGSVKVPTTALTGTPPGNMPSQDGYAVATDQATGHVSNQMLVELVMPN
jgi:hypothetical protein